MFCRSQGFAGPTACILPKGHTGSCKYGDIHIAETEQLRQDALRYRFLRENGGSFHDQNKYGISLHKNERFLLMRFMYWCPPEKLDEIIDKAIQSQEG